MKVVFATPYEPEPPNFGGARRIFELVRGIQRNHHVSVISLVSGSSSTDSGSAEIRSIVGVPVSFTARDVSTRARRALQLRSLASRHSSQYRLYYHPTFQRKLNRHLAASGADVVQLEFSQMGAYRIDSAIPSVLDVHNIEHELVRQMAKSGSAARRLFSTVEFRKLRSEEIQSWRAATCCIATSNADSELVASHTGRDVPIIRNGVDVGYFQSTQAEVKQNSIVFVGAMRYRPNADAAHWFVERILPTVRKSVPEVTFAIIGADPPAEIRALADEPGVSVTGTVADIRPWLQSAYIAVAPLRIGSGTRIKILEAFAAGRPVVSTTVGATGIDAGHRTHLLLADDADGFAASVVELLTEPERADRLAASANRLVRERYQWKNIADRLNEVYVELATRCRSESSTE